MTTSAEVRASIIDALRLDLVGPSPQDTKGLSRKKCVAPRAPVAVRGKAPGSRNSSAISGFWQRSHGPPLGAECNIYFWTSPKLAEEVLPTAPSKWYLTGFLVPFEAPPEERSDDTGDDELDLVANQSPGDDEKEPEKASARKAFFPSSMGLSVLVRPDVEVLYATVTWGDYRPLKDDSDEQQGSTSTSLKGVRPAWGQWRRIPRVVEIPFHIAKPGSPETLDLGEGEGMKLVVSSRVVPRTRDIPEGTRAVSVFLVNHRSLGPDVKRDVAYAFQTELAVTADRSFVPRPNVRGLGSDDPDVQIADLQYRDVAEYAVGHNVSARADALGDGECRVVRTCWLPAAEVEKVDPRQVEGADLTMETLGAAADGATVRELAGPMVQAYGQWIETQPLPLDGERRLVAEDLLRRAKIARKRIDAGLAALDDPEVCEAFRIANRAVARAIRQRATHDRPDLSPGDVDPPVWHPFQLAFLLMNIPGTIDSDHGDRRVVDLLFFPTGGGKTEAYLGLAAFTMVLRRLRDPSIRSAGVSVLMRYTLRLLTLDQLGRAATMICALELERQQDIEKLGRWPFEIGLWVGQTATPNRMGRKGDKDRYTARAKTIAFQNDDKGKPSPIPLESCPWCGSKFNRNSFMLLPTPDQPQDLRVTCSNRSCEFHSRRQREGLPILAVDEPIYRRLPAFVIATVDKFANLPWVGDTAGLFGRVERFDRDGFYGPCHKGRGRPLDGGLPPPDLVIQDELHLISGPLGTMVGLYETVIDALSKRPKIVASTATVRRASRQIQGLFGRGTVDVFPPPGPDRRDSFFAVTVPSSEKNARVYLGVAAQGRNLKVVLLNTYLALCGAAQKQWNIEGGARNKTNPADPYLTLVGYFNALRELGGSRRIVEDEVTARLADYGTTRRRVSDDPGLFANRKLSGPEELTSRVPTNKVAQTKQRLARTFHEKDRLDVVLATNMISVGLDITRLGLMVVLGQPKTAAEYIQATSRVGRDEERPGLVVTLLNIHRPRDRSHYERFEAWHESFYRAVEATSVTPFSPRAIDRGVAAVAVALARLGHEGLTAPRSAAEVATYRRELDFVVEEISRRAEGHSPELTAEGAEELRQRVRARVIDLLDSWEHIADTKGDLQYQREVGVAPPLLFDPLDPELAKQPREARKKQKVAVALEGFTDEKVWEHVQERKRGGSPPQKGIKQVEIETLLSQSESIGEDTPEGDFYAKSLPLDRLPGWLRDKVERIVLVHRLREVIAQVGFTRFEAAIPDVDGELCLDIKPAPLSRDEPWVPASENRGEGVFIAFKEEAIEAWASRRAVQARGRTLLDGFEAWQERRHQPKARFAGLPYIMLHSLSHLLITAVSLECGYAASAIRERVYAGSSGYGILLYTGSPGPEGTLGGLVEIGRRLDEHLLRALELGRLCSNDPICAQHDPKNVQEERFLHGAACHGCLLIAETSCERRNELLDRALVVPTVRGSGAELFADFPGDLG